MTLFRELITYSTSTENLQSFVIKNIHRFHVLNNGTYKLILFEKDDCREFIETKSEKYRSLDYELIQCKAFISVLFDFCERFGWICYDQIENAIVQHNLFRGSRREAARLFLIHVRQDTDYVIRFEQICTLLQCSIETEEDSEVKPVVTFLNYLAKVIRDTSEEIINSVCSKVRIYSANKKFPFLHNQVIQDVCAIPIDEIDLANVRVQKMIESFLGHVLSVEPDIEEVTEKINIENDTPYSKELVADHISFDRIRRIALDKCANITTELHGRGVTPLRNEMEMFIYLKRYGNMHRSKLLSVLELFPFSALNSPVEIIDWGCGQGLASLVLIDFLKENRISVKIRKIILIEPSEICLKRAALHISLARNDIVLKSVCNVFNHLSVEDIQTSTNSIKLHLFSNVLDLDEALFSQSILLENIIISQKGTNYFLCISPYITDEKADRVDGFKRYFEDKFETFVSLKEETTTKSIEDDFWLCNNNRNSGNILHGRYLSCEEPRTITGGCCNKWTRIIRVFKVDL